MIPTQRLTDYFCYESARYTEKRGDDKPTRIPARHQQLGYDADSKPDKECSEYMHTRTGSPNVCALKWGLARKRHGVKQTPNSKIQAPEATIALLADSVTSRKLKAFNMS